MARLVLSKPGEDAITGGSNIQVFGTAAPDEVITVLGGNVTFDSSFNRGGDTIVLSRPSGDYTIQRIGSQVLIAGEGITLRIPVGTAGIEIEFADKSLDLRIDPDLGGAVIGDQLVTDRAEAIDADPLPAPQTPVIAEVGGNNGSAASAQLIDPKSFRVASNANLDDDSLPSARIEGSLSANIDEDFYKITLREGEMLVLDVDGVTDGLDTVIRIFGPNGVLLIEGDDAIRDPGSAPHPGGGNGTQDSFIAFRAPEAGTYTFSVSAWDNGSSGDYDLHVSLGPPLSAEETIAEDVAAMLSGYSWDALALTYGFPTLAGQYPAGSTDGEELDNFEPFSPAQQAAVQQMLAMYAGVSGLGFQQLAGNPGLANLRYAMSDLPETAHAAYPTGSAGSGTSWYNNSGGTYDNPVPGNYAFVTLIHETGHSLGLKHPHSGRSVSLARDTLEYSVMSYRSYSAKPLGPEDGYTNDTFGYPQSPMMYDIAALQKLYGADYSFNSGNSTYSWNPDTGQMSINGAAQPAPGANRVFLTIWDGGGNDTYDFSGYSSGVHVDLRPGEWTITSAVQRANLGDGNFARGNIANALLHEGDPRSMIENAIGGSGSDTFVANSATNRLTGNGGADIFRWLSIEDGDAGRPADTITGFLRDSDRIDLSRIDAVSATSGDDAFSFIGTAAFSGKAGELRFQQEGNSLRIQADVDGDKAADFHLILQDITQVRVEDFIL